jgi:ribosomal 50S subunit-associated protein YjgA (DUF615 family)
LAQRAFGEALRMIESGIEAIHDFLDEYNQNHRAEECVELASLERWRDEILSREEGFAAARPKSKAGLLRQKLQQAVTAEEFEEAARLRDELRCLAENAPTDDEDSAAEDSP